MAIIIGIDPGVSGAYAVYCTEKKKFLEIHSFKTLKYRGFGQVLKKYRGCIVAKERVWATGGDSPKTLTSLLPNSGGYEAICDMLNIKVLLATPQQWQKMAVDRKFRGDPKERAHQAIKRLFPRLNLIPPRCKVENHNWVDAALIAYYGSLVYQK